MRSEPAVGSRAESRALIDELRVARHHPNVAADPTDRCGGTASKAEVDPRLEQHQKRRHDHRDERHGKAAAIADKGTKRNAMHAARSATNVPRWGQREA